MQMAAKRQASLLSFINSSTVPSEKKPKPDQKEYDRDGNRKIKPEWFTQFEWLKLEKQDSESQTRSTFVCQICREGHKTNIFTIGKPADKPKKDDFVKHEASKDHREAASIPKLKKDLTKATTNAYMKCEKGVTALMRTVYTMAKQQISTRTLNALTEMQILNGCDDLKPLLNISQSKFDDSQSTVDSDCAATTMTYTHHESVDEIYEVLSDSIEGNILDGLKRSTFFSLQIDEGTDCSNLSTLMIYVRYLIHGKVCTKYISVEKLPGATASAIFDVLMQFLTDKGINVCNLIGIASDGASVMQGDKNGVTSKLKSYCPFLIRCHCIAHRLALASEKACKQVPYMVKFIDVINRLGKLCKFSPKFCRELEISKSLHGNNSAGKLKQIFFTRWLSFNDCIEAMVNCIDSLIACLHSVRNDAAHGVTATGLLKNVATYKFIATTYFCADIIGILSILSKCMQKQSLLYSNVKSQIESSIAAILILQEQDGPYFKEFKSLVAVTPPSEFPMTTSFISHDISDSEKQRKDFLLVRKCLVQNIVKYMENWFPDSGIMNAFCCLDPMNRSCRSTEQFEELISHFGTPKNQNDHVNADKKLLEPIIDKRAARTEYSVLECVMKNQDNTDIQQFYCDNIHNNDEAYPNLKLLYEAALVCPSTSVDCERGFSQYNLIKTNHRNLLTVKHVKQLAMVSIEGPELSLYNFREAFNVWISKKDRRAFKVMFDLECKSNVCKEPIDKTK